jgi:uncharacterized lipoprotein YajG
MNRCLTHSLIAMSAAIFLLTGCNQTDRSQTKGVDSTQDAKNDRDPAKMKSMSMQPASGADASAQPAPAEQGASSAAQPMGTH